ncbi:MAG: PilZ domain-containing protein [Candidatus Omnitrophica bacterium]|nr:PilZ domain-containing protein [Candidatus Omnitrophota bacterium]MDD5351616.1 PilZ domain-containing protein [Candidatus Omnitrophota bacterium]MDD5550826.1 PilZ domain-containing protein [Candidatus Omnitrophota bacterium]
MQERRKYPRFDVAARVDFKKINQNNNSQGAFVKNVSAEGFCFACQEAFSPGDVLEVNIIEKSIDSEPICVKGEVVWSYKDPAAKDSKEKYSFLIGIKVLGIRKTDEARFVMLYCERMLAELKSFLRISHNPIA